jgi:hypothetical protein
MTDFDSRTPVDGLTFRRYLATQTRNRHARRFWNRHDKSEYTCPSCGRGDEDIGDAWEVHHKDGDPFNGHAVNLVAVCHNCHKHTHSAARVAEQLADWKEGFLALGTDTTAVSADTTGQTTLGDFTRTEVQA